MMLPMKLTDPMMTVKSAVTTPTPLDARPR
jgi:hypothetical protein